MCFCESLHDHLIIIVIRTVFLLTAIQATVLSVENSDEYTLRYKVTVHENFTVMYIVYYNSIYIEKTNTLFKTCKLY